MGSGYMTEPAEIKVVSDRLREIASELVDLSNTVIRIRHTNDYVVSKTEKLDGAVAQMRSAYDSIQSACIELLAAGHRLP